MSVPVIALAQSQAPQAAHPGTPVSSGPGPDDPSFRSAAQSAPGLSLTPEMILELGRRYRENQNAREEVMAPSIAMPVTRSVNASMGPGGATSIIQAVQGYPTAIAFVDATGQPWPIAWDTNSNPASEGSGGATGTPAVQATGFDVRVPVKGSNVLQLAPRSSAPRGGVLVNLQGAPAPLTFMIMAGRDRYGRPGRREGRRSRAERPGADHHPAKHAGNRRCLPHGDARRRSTCRRGTAVGVGRLAG